jgi:hypothetical protein
MDPLAGDMVLNDPDVCISPGDKYASKVQGSAICNVPLLAIVLSLIYLEMFP